ncbi:MAG: SLBB domain-containing protein [Elusimicrobiota bacterium]
MNKKTTLFTLILTLAFAFLTVSPAIAALSKKTLDNDLTYYRKTSNEQKLDANDRYYILLKIEDKYKGTKIDLAPLKKEIAKLELAKKDPDETAAGIVSGISAEDTGMDSRIAITAGGVQRTNYFIMRDPDPAVKPKLILDLYGVQEKLSDKDKDIQVNSGAFSNVRAGQFQQDPEKIVRIVAEFREEKPYKIKNEQDKWLIIVEKSKQEQSAFAAAPPVTGAAVTGSTDITASTQAKSNAPVNYTIDTGDVLGILVYPAEELSRETVVQIDGTITMALIGQIEAKGQTTKKLEDTLIQKLGKYISNPQVSVTVKQFSRRQVFITGEVRSVGAYSYKENMRLMDFISQVGGFTDNANRSDIKIYRGPPTKRQTIKADVDELIRSGDFSKDFALEPGDIIEVPKGAKKVAVLGDVNKPGYYDYRENLRILELVSLSGGFTDSANISKINVIRDAGGKDRKVIKVDLKKVLNGKEKDTEIQSGDTVYIPKKAMASGNLFLNTILPWLSLIVLIIAIRGAV